MVEFTIRQIFLNTDCGFGCVANRCVNEEEVAVAKLEATVAGVFCWFGISPVLIIIP